MNNCSLETRGVWAEDIQPIHNVPTVVKTRKFKFVDQIGGASPYNRTPDVTELTD
jgi:hypothetical protein